MYVVIISHIPTFYKYFVKKEVIFMGKTRARGNGEGTIFKRTIKGKTKWVCEYTLVFNDGEREKNKKDYLR